MGEIVVYSSLGAVPILMPSYCACSTWCLLNEVRIPRTQRLHNLSKEHPSRCNFEPDLIGNRIFFFFFFFRNRFTRSYLGMASIPVDQMTQCRSRGVSQ